MDLQSRAIEAFVKSLPRKKRQEYRNIIDKHFDKRAPDVMMSAAQVEMVEFLISNGLNQFLDTYRPKF